MLLGSTRRFLWTVSDTSAHSPSVREIVGAGVGAAEGARKDGKSRDGDRIWEVGKVMLWENRAELSGL